jgi:hypothetical protein
MSDKTKPAVTFDTYPISVAIWENAPGKGPFTRCFCGSACSARS